MSRKSPLFILLILLSGCTLNAAATPVDNAANPVVLPSKFYVASALGLADSGWDSAGYNSTGIGFNATIGYHYSRYWSFEGGFTRLPKSTLSSLSINTNAVSTFAKVRLPIDINNISFFSKLGVAMLFNSGESTASHLALGMAYGVDYPIQPNLDIEAQFTHYIGRYQSNPVPNADFYSVGVNYRLPQKVFQ